MSIMATNTTMNKGDDSAPGEQASSSTTTTTTTPFEWLTSPDSLRPHILSALQQQQEPSSTSTDDSEEDEAAPGCRILHVGCGSSVLGEILVSQSSVYRNVHQVVNVDSDADTLRQMQERWQTIIENSSSNQHDDNDDRMLFECIDFTRERLQAWDDASFDLVLDKSTLDCLLCTDQAAAGLLTEVYRVLKPGGVYLLVSFHEAAFLRPLLAGLPGADWVVSDCVMPRQVEDLIAGSCSRSTSRSATGPTEVIGSVQQPPSATPPPFHSSVEEDEAVVRNQSDYRRTVNVFQCRKRQANVTAATNSNRSNSIKHDEHQLDWDAVYHHVHDTNDQWFRKENPMLSEERKRQIQEAFGDESLALDDAYSVLFTDAEREHLEYEGYLQDWQAFCKSRHETVEVDRISADDAIAFLDEMQ